jgi:hypothetical protein
VSKKTVDPMDKRVQVAVTLPLWLVVAMAKDPNVTNRSLFVEAAIVEKGWYSKPVEAAAT